MTESIEPGQLVAAPGQQVAELVASHVASAPMPTTALGAANAIQVWCSVELALFELIEAKIMEACWRIREEYSEPASFKTFCERHLGGAVEAEEAWLMAQTWGAGRKNRSLRELAVRRGGEAIAFMRHIVAAGPRGMAILDEDQNKVTEILTAPPAQRMAMVRDLIEAKKCAQERRHPDDVREIEVLTRERDSLREQTLNGRDSSGEEIRDAVADLRRVESEIAGIAGRLAEAMPGANQAHRNMLMAAAYKLREYLDTITGLAVGSASD